MQFVLQFHTKRAKPHFMPLVSRVRFPRKQVLASSRIRPPIFLDGCGHDSRAPKTAILVPRMPESLRSLELVVAISQRGTRTISGPARKSLRTVVAADSRHTYLQHVPYSFGLGFVLEYFVISGSAPSFLRDRLASVRSYVPQLPRGGNETGLYLQHAISPACNCQLNSQESQFQGI